MKKWLLSGAAFLLLASSASILAPVRAKAMIVNVPWDVTLLRETMMYEDEAFTKPAGSLSPLQTVHITKRDSGWSMADHTEEKGYLIETWQGEKWIKVDPETLVPGKYKAETATITLVDKQELYDEPLQEAASGTIISPQQVTVTGTIEWDGADFGPPRTITFYRIQTWLGDKWIYDSFYKEAVREKAVSTTVDLFQDTDSFELPYTGLTKKGTLKTGRYPVTAVWELPPTLGDGSPTWYKVSLPDGERWILPEDELAGVRETTGKIELPTGGKGFAKPTYYDDETYTEVAPGSYDAFETWKDGELEWVHIRTESEALWVNPGLALKVRPAGIIPTDEDIPLTPRSATYKYPDWSRIHNMKGFFAPQTVKAFEKWLSPEGITWYHVHGTWDDWWIPENDAEEPAAQPAEPEMNSAAVFGQNGQ
ncbi:hypothetical protein ACWGPW_06460 [Paenibacillus chitinolyticus]